MDEQFLLGKIRAFFAISFLVFLIINFLFSLVDYSCIFFFYLLQKIPLCIKYALLIREVLSEVGKLWTPQVDHKFFTVSYFQRWKQHQTGAKSEQRPLLSRWDAERVSVSSIGFWNLQTNIKKLFNSSIARLRNSSGTHLFSFLLELDNNL